MKSVRISSDILDMVPCICTYTGMYTWRTPSANGLQMEITLGIHWGPGWGLTG